MNYGYQQEKTPLTHSLIGLVFVIGVIFVLIWFNNTPYGNMGGDPDETPVVDVIDKDTTPPQPDVQPHGDIKYPRHWIVVVEESRNRPAKIQMSLQRTDFWKKKLLLEYGLKYFRFDPDTTEAKEFITEAKAFSVDAPFCCIISPEGKMVKAFAFPTGATSDESLELVKKEL